MNAELSRASAQWLLREVVVWESLVRMMTMFSWAQYFWSFTVVSAWFLALAGASQGWHSVR